MKLQMLMLASLAGHAGLAQSAAAFTSTGNMTTPREGHSATLLPNGKVLIAGGNQSELPARPLATAELYDPAAGTFTATGNMTTPRTGHTATLLPNGRVLMVGGTTDLSAEVYDSSTETFTATPNMLAVPVSPATLLPDGTVLIPSQPTAQIYDPVSASFRSTGAYAEAPPLLVQAAVLRADGLVLMAGFAGTPSGAPTGPWSELYAPSSGAFLLPSNEIDNWLDVYTATLLTNGGVLFIGNDENDGLPADAELYEPAAEAFTSAGSAGANHEFGDLTLLPDGNVLITGGQLPGGDGGVVSELYAPNGIFAAAGNMLTGRHHHTTTLLADGRVLIAGGFNIWPSGTSSAELYHPATAIASPDLFSVAGYGGNQGAIWHTDSGQPASPDHPAIAGETLAMYTDRLTEGSLIPPQVTIGGQVAQILFFGDAPGYPGYFQVNLRMPDSVSPGTAVPVRLTYLGRSSNEVTIAIQ